MPDDAKLLAALRARSPDAFHELFELYSDRMFGLEVSILGNEMEAEEIVQDAFVRFIEKPDEFEGRSKIGTWLYRTTHNASVDIMRKRKSSPGVPEVSLSDSELPMPTLIADWRTYPEYIQSNEEIKQQLDRAMTDLSDSLRAVFWLRDVEEMSTKHIAEILKITPGAVKVRLHRARLLLREKLAEYFSEKA